MNDELEIIEDDENIALPAIVGQTPEEQIEFAKRAADVLRKIITKKHIQKIGNSEHLKIEAWQTVGTFFNVTAQITATDYVEYGKGKTYVRGYRATAVAVNTGTGEVMSRANAFCLNDEHNWKKKELYALASMAETRAASKVLRLVFAWVVVLAGYSPTPAEEMSSAIKTNEEAKVVEQAVAAGRPEDAVCHMGKWKGKTLGYIKQHDYSYLRWLAYKADDTTYEEAARAIIEKDGEK